MEDLRQVIVQFAGTLTVDATDLMNGLIFQSATHAVSHAAGVQGDLDATMDECLQEALQADHQVVEAMGDHQEVEEIQYAGSVCRTHVSAPEFVNYAIDTHARVLRCRGRTTENHGHHRRHSLISRVKDGGKKITSEC